MSDPAPRIVFVGPHLGRHPGCVPSPAEDLAPYLERAGYEVRLTSDRRGALARTWSMARDLVRWRREVDVMVLSVFSGRSFRLVDGLSRLASGLGLRQVHVLHGGGLRDLFARRSAVARRVLGRASLVVAPSAWLADAASASLGIDARVVPNVLPGVTPSSARARSRPSVAEASEPRLLWMRTFHDVYDPRMALEALAELRRQGVSARLTMAGQDKGLAPDCRALAARLGLSEAVDFAGFLDIDGKRAAFTGHDFFLNTNRVDNAPVTVVEAMAAGLPVVATEVGGVPRLLESSVGSAGVLVPAGDAGAMASAIRDLAVDPVRYRRLSAAGLEIAAAHDASAVVRAWQGVFAALGLGA